MMKNENKVPCFMGNGIVKWIDGYTEEEYAEMRRKSIEKSIALYEYEQLSPILKRKILYEKYYDFIKGKISISECLSYYELLSKIFIDTIPKVEYDQKKEYLDSLGIIQDIFKKIENIHPNGGYPPSETPDRVNPAIQEMIEKGQIDQKPVGGKYNPRKGMREFILWCVSYSGYADDFTPKFFYDKFHHRCKESTIERYFSDAKAENK